MGSANVTGRCTPGTIPSSADSEFLSGDASEPPRGIAARSVRVHLRSPGGVGSEVGGERTPPVQLAMYRAIENPRQESPIARILWLGWITIAAIRDSQCLPPKRVATLPSPPKVGSSRPPVV